MCKFCSFWLVLNASFINMTDFTLWNIKDFTLTESKLLLLSSWLGTVTFILFVHPMHASGWLGHWPHLHSSPGGLAYCYEVILLSTCTACFPECWALFLAVCCTTVLTVVYHKLYILFFALLLIISQFSCHYVCDQSLSHFSFCLMLYLYLNLLCPH